MGTSTVILNSSAPKSIQTVFTFLLVLLVYVNIAVVQSYQCVPIPSGGGGGGVWKFVRTARSPPNGNVVLDRVRSVRVGLLLIRMAKPSPSLNFNLEEIEAFEKELGERAKRNAEADVDDLDDDDDDLDEWEDDSEESTLVRVVVPDSMDGLRIDAALCNLLKGHHNTAELSSSSLSRSACGELVNDGRVSSSFSVDSEADVTLTKTKTTVVNRKATKVVAGQTLEVSLPKPRSTEIVPQKIPLNILYEDEHMIVVNKAAGMVVHPAAGNWDGTLVNALAHYLVHESPLRERRGEDDLYRDNLNDDENDDNDVRPGIVHRLDKGTTGVLVVAKTAVAHAALSQSFARRRVGKTYLAVTVGSAAGAADIGKTVVLDGRIGRHPTNRQKMRVVPDTIGDPRRQHRPPLMTSFSSTSPRKKKYGAASTAAAAAAARAAATTSKVIPNSVLGRPALSRVTSIATSRDEGNLALVEVAIETGRTHQIRVHLSDRRTPVYGDDVYGASDWNNHLRKRHGIERPLLHAYRLELDHPVDPTLGRMTFVAPLADDMARVVDTLWPDGRDQRPEYFAPQ